MGLNAKGSSFSEEKLNRWTKLSPPEVYLVDVVVFPQDCSKWRCFPSRARKQGRGSSAGAAAAAVVVATGSQRG